uniref:Uncharacterized protein n=1 Tax=Trepomonas sp. PC1 TaxID=1076344 RepID=A0A146KDZ2_9EUKA|eukprot:JAP95050.1 Hypothetical protein TPC1_12075 [Trepomonas sp. PC1]
MIITKDLFSQAIQQLLQKHPELAQDTEADRYQAFAHRYNSKSKWRDLAEILHVTTKQAHDYFYNSWSQQFFDDPADYRCEIRDIYVSLLKHETKCDAITKAIQHLQTKYHDKAFYRHQLYQYLYNYKPKQRKMTKKSKLEPCKVTTVNNSQTTQAKVQFDIFESVNYLLFE